jgi:hypothetical protein
MTQKESLEVLETPLKFSGEPEIGRRRDRSIIVNDIAAVHAHSCRSAAGWHPVCTLQFYGSEEVTLALEAVPERAVAHAAARELAALFRQYVDEDRFDENTNYRDGWPCAACMSSGMREPPTNPDTLGNDTSKGTTS